MSSRPISYAARHPQRAKGRVLPLGPLYKPKVNDRVLIKARRADDSSQWLVARVVYDHETVDGKYTVDVKDQTGTILQRDDVSVANDELRQIPLEFPLERIRNPPRNTGRQVFSHQEFVWAEVPLSMEERMYGVYQQNEAWYPAIYLYRGLDNRHIVLILDGPYANKPKEVLRVGDYHDGKIPISLWDIRYSDPGEF